MARIGQVQGLIGADETATSRSLTRVNGSNAAQFDALLSKATGRQAQSAGAASSMPSTMQGIPILTIADQYRAMGLPVPTAGVPIAGMYGPAGAGGTSGISGSGVRGSGARMVALAQRELGVRESPSGSNDSTRIREYRTATAGARDTPGPWCAYFVSWLAKSAGAPIGAGGKGTGYVPTLEAWSKQQNRFSPGTSSRPNPGDMIIFDWGRDGTADHVGIVERVDSSGRIHTIEGNSSDMVKRRDYPAGSSNIRGYVRMG